MASLPPIRTNDIGSQSATPTSTGDSSVVSPINRAKSLRSRPSTPTPSGSRKPSMTWKTGESIPEEPAARGGRESVVSEISRFSIDSDEENGEVSTPKNQKASNERIRSSYMREEAFFTPRSPTSLTPTPGASGRRRSSAISSSGSLKALRDPHNIGLNRPTHIDLPEKPYPAGEGLLLKTPQLAVENEQYLPTSPTNSSIRAIKSPPASGTGTERTMQTAGSDRTILSGTTGGRAEKALHVPFLPKVLQTTTRNDQCTPQPNQKGEFQVEAGDSGSPVFESDADTSVANITIGEAHTASNAGRPRLVQRFSNRVIGLREILDRGPEAASNVDRMNSIKRQGIIGLPETRESDSDVVTPHGTGLLLPDEAPKNSFGFFPQGLVDGLRSNPVTKAIRGKAPDVRSSRASVVSNGDGQEITEIRKGGIGVDPRSPAGKKVSFPLPLRLVEHRDREEVKRRQSIVSTPYPLGYQSGNPTNGGRSRKDEAPLVSGSHDMLTIAIYTSSTGIPKIRQIAIPSPVTKTLFDLSNERGPPTVARIIKDFDDEKLFRVIKKEFYAVRGLLRGRFGAASIRAIRLAEYDTVQDLVGIHLAACSSTRTSIGTGKEFVLEETLINLFLHPKTGRKQHRWTTWLSSLPGNTARPDASNLGSSAPSGTNEPITEGDQERAMSPNAPTAPALSRSPKSYAIMLEGGLSASRIFTAVAFVIVLAIVATLLWIFLGLTGQSGTYPSTVGSPDDHVGANSIVQSGKIREAGFRDAGNRVQTGMVIGIAMLLTGLSGVVGWVGIEYLAR